MSHFISYKVTSAPAAVHRKIEKALENGTAQPEVIFSRAGSYEGLMLFWAQAGNIVLFLEKYPNVALVASWITTESDREISEETIGDLDFILMKSGRVRELVRQTPDLKDVRQVIRHSRSSFVIICLPPT